MKAKIKADITVEVSLRADSVWPEDTTVEQVKRQALADFAGKIGHINSPSIQNDIQRVGYGIRVIGEPHVKIIVIEED